MSQSSTVLKLCVILVGASTRPQPAALDPQPRPPRPEGLAVDLIQPVSVRPPEAVKRRGQLLDAAPSSLERRAEHPPALEAAVGALSEHWGDGVGRVAEKEDAGGAELRTPDALPRRAGWHFGHLDGVRKHETRPSEENDWSRVTPVDAWLVFLLYRLIFERIGLSPAALIPNRTCCATRGIQASGMPANLVRSSDSYSPADATSA